MVTELRRLRLIVSRPVLPEVDGGRALCRRCVEPALRTSAPPLARAFLCTLVSAALTTPTGVLAQAQGDTSAPSGVLVPRLSVSETISDNISIAAGASSGGKRGDQITQISPGFSINSHGARVKASADYSLNEFLYMQDSSRNNRQNSLNSSVSIEALENWAYVDFHGGISQQNISAFGTQNPNSYTTNTNRTETATLNLSPYVRGRISDSATYELRNNWSASHSKSSLAADVESTEWLAKLSGSTAFQNLGWSVSGTQQDVTYSGGRDAKSSSLRGTLNYRITPQLMVFLQEGRETSNYTARSQSNTTAGYGLEWSPSERTRLSAQRENRFFGDGHTVSLSHRTPLSSWQFTDSRNVSILPNQMTLGSLGNIYDLLFTQFASQEPDLIKRGQLVNRFLQANGIPANTQVVGGFLSTSASVLRSQSLSVALTGARNTVTLLLTQNESQRLGASTGPNDPFANASTIRQRGLNINWSLRLSGFSTLNVAGSTQRSSGSGSTTAANADTTMRSLNLTLSTSLTPKVSASVAARHSVFDSTTNPYTENAITGTVTARF